LFLEPAEQTSLSFALAAEWVAMRSDLGAPTAKSIVGQPLFPEAGVYLLQFRYVSSGWQDEKALVATAEITVREPGDEEKAIIGILSGTPALGSALLRPVDSPERNLVPVLKSVIKRWPRSAYADYARFALARFYGAQGGPKYRIHWAKKDTLLEAIT